MNLDILSTLLSPQVTHVLESKLPCLYDSLYIFMDIIIQHGKLEK